uniref:Uncharacterized protein n=2 Tax=Kalanchoe fedtschenkoi TaxID=63787 RepID=A0A7N0T1B5_KALFE
MADHPVLIATSNQRPKQLHIVMFPWLAFGHIIPYLELAKLMAAKGHRISFVSTTRNIDRLPKIPPNLSHLIHLVKLKLQPVENLPLDAEATTDVPLDKVEYLKLASDKLQGEMTEFLQLANPDWILYDFTAPWISPVAKRLDIPCAYFSIFIPAVICFIPVPTSDMLQIEEDRRTPEQFTVRPKWIPFETSVAFHLHEITKIFSSVEGVTASGITDMERLVASLRDCDLICIRACKQFDPEWIQLAEKLHGKPVIPVGQLPTAANDNEADNSSSSNHDHWLQIKGWLDQQRPASVIYVSFGSEAKPTQEEVTELAYGLETCGLPFFWVLRTRRGEADQEAVKLPQGFEDRIGMRGLVYTSWVPQLRILSHESVGGFLSHSGWSSVVEALQCAKPLVLMTFLAEQGLNARVLEEKKIGYPLPRRKTDGWFSRGAVAQSVRLVVVEEEGRVYREKAKEMSRLFGDRVLQDSYTDNLLALLASWIQ